MSGDAFVGLQRIKFLNLEGNSIKAIGGNTLAHLSGCIILDLRNDSFSTIRFPVKPDLRFFQWQHHRLHHLVILYQ